jgi:uncharacterized protein YcbX
MKVGSLSDLRRYPVKSMGGETLAESMLSVTGVVGDRAWAVRDEVRGGIRGAKQLSGLMKLKAHYQGAPAATGSSPAEILFEDGTTASTGDPQINERLSAALNHAVTLWPLLPPDVLDHYRRGAPDHEDLEQELRQIFGRNADEPLPDLSLFPPETFEFESPPGTYFDLFPLLIMTESSLRAMQKGSPDSIFDARRFRPNLLISDTDSSVDFPERDWAGRRLKIGEAVIEVTIECPRCVMVTHGFDDLPRDHKVMRSVVKQANGNLGVYAKVETPGLAKVGDSVELLD